MIAAARARVASIRCPRPAVEVRAIRVQATGDPAGGGPTEAIGYVVTLAGGDTLSLIGTARRGDTTTLDLIDAMVRSVSR